MWVKEKHEEGRLVLAMDSTSFTSDTFICKQRSHEKSQASVEQSKDNFIRVQNRFASWETYSARLNQNSAETKWAWAFVSSPVAAGVGWGEEADANNGGCKFCKSTWVSKSRGKTGNSDASQILQDIVRFWKMASSGRFSSLHDVGEAVFLFH